LRRMFADFAARDAAPALVSAVAFGDGAKTLFRDIPARQLAASDAIRMIESAPLRLTKGADVAGALKRAGKIACEQLRAQRAMPIRACIVADTRPSDLLRTSAVMTRIRSLPIEFEALSFGGDADVALLDALVSCGRGGGAERVGPETFDAALRRA